METDYDRGYADGFSDCMDEIEHWKSLHADIDDKVDAYDLMRYLRRILEDREKV